MNTVIPNTRLAARLMDEGLLVRLFGEEADRAYRTTFRGAQLLASWEGRCDLG